MDNNNQIYSPNIPTPQPIEEKQEQSNLEVKEPVYQLQVLPEQRHNIPAKQSCCEDCCDCNCSADACVCCIEFLKCACIFIYCFIICCSGK